jgi:hypothetical protein
MTPMPIDDEVRRLGPATAAAFSRLAGWSTIPPTSGDGQATPATPAVIADTRFAQPLEAVAARIVAQLRRDAIVIRVDGRSRLPGFDIAVARSTSATPTVVDYVPWLSADARELWLTGAAEQLPTMPFYHLAAEGLEAYRSAPWQDPRDRTLGRQHALIVLARLIGAAA